MRITVGRLQMLIMEVLWKDGGATARQITEQVCQSTPTTLSTVQTLLRKLAAKGAVSHEQQGKSFVFSALVPREAVERSAAQDLLDRVFKGSVKGLVAHLLTEEEISQDELTEIRELIEKKRKEGSK